MLKGDLFFALRTWRRAPTFILLAILALGLGIGANTAIFSVVDAALLRPLPYPEPDRLVALWEENAERGWFQARVAPANFLDWKEQAGGFSQMAAYGNSPNSYTMTGQGEPERVEVALVTPEYLEILGATPVLGRSLRPEENWEGRSAVAVLSHGFWQRRFAGRDVLGEPLVLDGYTVEVVGVMDPDFRNLNGEVDLWVPFGWSQQELREQEWARQAHFLRVLGRLGPGVSPQQAEAQLVAIAERLEERYPKSNETMSAGLTPLRQWVSGETRTPLYILLGAVGFVLLISCANVANLLLVRAQARSQEIAIRSALGASQGRIAGQMLVESVLLASLGGLLGLVIGAVGVELLGAVSLEFLPQLAEIRIDGRVLLFTAVVSLLTGLAFGLAPALGSRDPDMEALRQAGGRAIGGRSAWARDLLVVLEVALALLLVIGAGLLIASLGRLQQVDPGFETENLLTLKISLPGTQYGDDAAIASFYQRLTEQLPSVPGVESAAGVMNLPLTDEHWTTDFAIEGRDRESYGLDVRHNSITPEYFGVMGVPVVRGRAFDASDWSGATRRLIINRTLAEQYFSDQDPVGQRMTFDRYPTSESEWWTIVGVVEDEKQGGLEKAVEPAVYLPHAQWPRSTMNLVVRSSVPPLGVVEDVRRKVHALDANLAIFKVRTMEQVLAESLNLARFVTFLLLLFAVVALVQAAIGIYGVMGYTVSRRVREIGVRMAFGARTTDVLGLVIRRGMVLVGLGLAVGLVAALLLSRFLSVLLYEVSAFDPVTFTLVIVLLALIGLAACFFPARRAARVDPIVALRMQ